MKASRPSIILLDRQVVYLEADPVNDFDVSHDDKTAEYVLAEVEDDYDEVVVLDANDVDPLVDEVVLLDVIIGEPTLELEVA